MRTYTFLLIPALVWPLALRCEDPPPKTELGELGFVESDRVRLHYITSGSGPLLVLLHGFPDFWCSWRRQIPAPARRDDLEDVRADHESETEWFAIDLPWARRDAFEVTRFQPTKPEVDRS